MHIFEKSRGHHGHHGHDHHHHDHSHPHSRGGGADPDPVLVELRRADVVLSRHRGSVVFCAPDGKRTRGVGHPAQPVMLGRLASVFGAVMALRAGGAESGRLGPEDIALLAGVYPLDGEPAGEKLKALLARLSLPEAPPGALDPALPAALIITARAMGWAPEGACRHGHPVQALWRETLARFLNYPAEQLIRLHNRDGSHDYGAPLVALAGAYARLAAPEEAGMAEYAAGCQKVMNSCAQGGSPCPLEKSESGPGLCLWGGEGLFAAALPAQGLGLAIKISDGAGRAVPVAVSRAMYMLGHDHWHGGKFADDGRARLEAVFSL